VAHRIEWDEQVAAVLEGRLDVAWVRTPIADAGLRIVPLFEDPEMIAIPAGHPLAKVDRVTLADVEDQPILRYDSAPAHHAGRQATVSGVRTMEEKLEAVALGHGLAFVPASATAYYQRADIVYLPVVGAPSYEVALATIAGQAERPEIDWFVKIAADHYDAALP
jgi:DNA-binding transcriptional LysR family regulator